MESSITAKSQALINAFANYPVADTRKDPADFAVALSGGVDSAVVLQAAKLSRRTVVAVTAHSASVADVERADASAIARLVDVEHRILSTDELSDASYARNDAQRCFYCKNHLFERIRDVYPTSVIVTGTNADDLGDYRPGLRAAASHQVFSPLADLGFGKQDVRQLAVHWNLPIHDKPASPCLSSRLAYGVPVTPERLARVEQAERWLRAQGLVEFRVRLHEGELARIEVPIEELPKLAESGFRDLVNNRFMQLGFRFVTLDLGGFQSGSLNRLVSSSELVQIET